MRKYFFVLSAILLLAASCKQQQPAQTTKQQDQTTGGSNGPNLTSPPPPFFGGREQQGMTLPPPPVFPSIEGVLQLSNNPAKGNLMLQGIAASEYSSGKNVLYIKTGRDFSALLGKKVIIYIKGPPYDFILTDMKAAQ